MAVLWDLVNPARFDPFGGFVRGYQGGQQFRNEREKRAVLAELGQMGPDIDYTQAATRLLPYDPQTAATLSNLGMAREDRTMRRENRAEDVAFREAQAREAERRFNMQYGLQRQTLEQGRLPAGFQRTETGLAPIPGGPADPAYVAQTNAAKGVLNITPAQKAADTQFGKEYADFASGGFADAQKNIQQLQGVVNQLKQGAELTGPVVGRMPDWMKQATGQGQAIQAREAVEEVVQRNLRLILGAQFTEKEGERLISRAFNPTLSPAENAQRLERLLNAMNAAMQAKIAAAQYFEQHGTLRGFQGSTRINAADLENAMNSPALDRPASNARVAPMQSGVPQGVDPGIWQFMTPEERALWR